jgi:O-antigen ligase
MFIAVVTSHFASTVEGLAAIRSFFLLTVLTQSLVIILQNATGMQFGLQYGVSGGGSWETARFAGTLVSPSVSGTFMVLGLLFAMGHLFGRHPTRRRAWVIVVFGLALLDLLLSETRSAWIGFAIAGSGLGWYLYRRGTLRGKVLMQIAAGGLVALLLATPALVKRLSAPHSDDAMVRWNLVVMASKMVRENPVLGMGLNTATNHIRQFATGNEGWIFIVHNEYLLIAAEMGFIGLAAFVWLVLGGFGTAASSLESEDAFISDTAAIVFWCLIALAWAMMLDHISSTMTHVYLWFLLGMAQGIAILRARSEQGARA